MRDSDSADAFAERFRNSVTAHADQAEAAKNQAREQEAMNVLIRDRSRTDVEQIRPLANDLVKRVNERLGPSAQQLVTMPACNGVSIMYGAEMVTIYSDRTSVFANHGCNEVKVNVLHQGDYGLEPDPARAFVTSPFGRRT